MAASATVAIWHWPLEASAAEIERLSATLSAEETRRAGAFRIAGHRERFIVAHAGVRAILGREIACAPSAIEYVTGPKGKPALVGATDVRFNLSHSQDLAVLAVGRGFEIGVDVERIRRIDDVERIAERFFAESESAIVARASGDARDRLFMRLWTCKEGYLKATGEGLSRPFDEVVVRLTGDGGVAGLEDPRGAPLPVSVHVFDPAPGYASALVAFAADVGRVQVGRYLLR